METTIYATSKTNKQPASIPPPYYRTPLPPIPNYQLLTRTCHIHNKLQQLSWIDVLRYSGIVVFPTAPIERDHLYRVWLLGGLLLVCHALSIGLTLLFGLYASSLAATLIAVVALLPFMHVAQQLPAKSTLANITLFSISTTLLLIFSLYATPILQQLSAFDQSTSLYSIDSNQQHITFNSAFIETRLSYAQSISPPSSSSSSSITSFTTLSPHYHLIVAPVWSSSRDPFYLNAVPLWAVAVYTTNEYNQALSYALDESFIESLNIPILSELQLTETWSTNYRFGTVIPLSFPYYSLAQNMIQQVLKQTNMKQFINAPIILWHDSTPLKNAALHDLYVSLILPALSILIALTYIILHLYFYEKMLIIERAWLNDTQKKKHVKGELLSDTVLVHTSSSQPDDITTTTKPDDDTLHNNNNNNNNNHHDVDTNNQHTSTQEDASHAIEMMPPPNVTVHLPPTVTSSSPPASTHSSSLPVDTADRDHAPHAIQSSLSTPTSAMTLRQGRHGLLPPVQTRLQSTTSLPLAPSTHTTTHQHTLPPSHNSLINSTPQASRLLSRSHHSMDAPTITSRKVPINDAHLNAAHPTPAALTHSNSSLPSSRSSSTNSLSSLPPTPSHTATHATIQPPSLNNTPRASLITPNSSPPSTDRKHTKSFNAWTVEKK